MVTVSSAGADLGGARALDRLIAMALLVQVTEMYRPLGYLTGQSSSTVNLAFTVLFAAYTIIRWRDARRLLLRAIGALWAWSVLLLIGLLLVLQILNGVVSGSRALYWLGYSMLFASILVAAFICWSRLGRRVTRTFFVWAICLTWGGFVVNLVSYNFIRAVMVYTGNDLASSLTFNRLVGFYPHPNMAGFALCLYLGCLVADTRFMRGSVFGQAVVLTLAISGVVVTGSRTSLTLLAVVLVVYFVRLARMPGSHSAQLLRSFAAPALLLGGIALGLVGFAQIAGPQSVAYNNIMGRIGTLTSGIEDDQSVSLRLSIIDQYLSSFWKAPLLGNGPEYAGTQILSGAFTNVSQNAWIEWAVRFGFVYPAVVATAVIVTLIAGRRARRAVDAWSTTSLVVTLITVASFSIVDFLWLRAPVAIIGMTLAAIITPPAQNAKADEPSTRTGDRERPLGVGSPENKYNRDAASARSKSSVSVADGGIVRA